MSEVRTVLLTHQEPECVDRMLRYWDRITPRSEVFLAFGGSKQHFAGLSHPHRALIDSPRLKTRDHQREKQSYAPVFQAAWEWLKSQDCSYVHFIEYDHIPLVEDFHRRMISFSEQERCDVAGFHIARIDGSSNAHYLQHMADPSFLRFGKRCPSSRYKRCSYDVWKRIILAQGSICGGRQFAGRGSDLSRAFPTYRCASSRVSRPEFSRTKQLYKGSWRFYGSAGFVR